MPNLKASMCKGPVAAVYNLELRAEYGRYMHSGRNFDFREVTDCHRTLSCIGNALGPSF